MGGLERVFEFSRNFRNEGMDKTHNPEFTAIEFYEAYADYKDMMVHFETLWEKACLVANGTTQITYQGHDIELKTPWPRMTCFEALKTIGGIDVTSMSDDDLKTESTASDSLKKQDGTFTDLSFSYGVSLDNRDRVYAPTDGYISTFNQSVPIVANSPFIKNSYSLRAD